MYFALFFLISFMGVVLRCLQKFVSDLYCLHDSLNAIVLYGFRFFDFIMSIVFANIIFFSQERYVYQLL